MAMPNGAASSRAAMPNPGVSSPIDGAVPPSPSTAEGGCATDDAVARGAVSSPGPENAAVVGAAGGHGSGGDGVASAGSPNAAPLATSPGSLEHQMQMLSCDPSNVASTGCGALPGFQDMGSAAASGGTAVSAGLPHVE